LVPSSVAGRAAEHHHDEDVFHLGHPDTDWEAGLIHAERIGLGTRNYELTEV
jgi:uncharacterized Fe-S center protein